MQIWRFRHIYARMDTSNGHDAVRVSAARIVHHLRPRPDMKNNRVDTAEHKYISRQASQNR